MANNLKKYNLQGEEIGTVEPHSTWMDIELHPQCIKDYVVAIRANLRQWSANTKGRSEVNHSTQKPHPQKKLGRARQGRLSSPQYKGGGVVFGPKPKFDQHIRVNKKQRRAAIRYLLTQRAKEGKLLVVEDTEQEKPQTKLYASFLKSLDLLKNSLFVFPGAYESIKSEEGTVQISISNQRFLNNILSIRNLKKAHSARAPQLNAYDLLKNEYIIVSESALNELMEV